MNGRIDGGDLQGKIVVVDFWATWCRPCLQAIPHNNEMAERYRDQGVRLFGICGTRGSDKAAFVRAKHDMRYTTGIDRREKTARAWGVQWWPYYVVIDRNGLIRAAGLAPNYVEDVVKALLEEQPLPADDEDTSEADADDSNE
jgi:thiol-disulfide isomerase/thioredoxin